MRYQASLRPMSSGAMLNSLVFAVCYFQGDRRRCLVHGLATVDYCSTLRDCISSVSIVAAANRQLVKTSSLATMLPVEPETEDNCGSEVPIYAVVSSAPPGTMLIGSVE